MHTAVQNPVASAAQGSKHTPSVCVVDPDGSAYQAWAAEAQKHSFKLEILPTASAALRHSQREHVALWVINTDLTDMSGGDLCQMLRSRDPRAQIYAVSNSYSADIERQAYQSGAQLYGAKPAHCDWLSQWQMHRQRKLVASHLNLVSRGK